MTMIDLMVVVAANLMNLLLAGMFLLRGLHKPKTGSFLGWAAVALALPLCAAAILNLSAGRMWAFYTLPLVAVAYCILELFLDGIYKIDFRSTRLLGPYLALYYLGLMALIGYAFLAGKPQGFITLATYFINLGITGWSFAKVGKSAHGG